MNLRPLGDRVVVRRDASEDKSAGGIVLPDAAKNKPQRGVIMAVGAGRMLKDGKRREPQIKVGDKVIFTNWAGDEFKQREGDNILLMREDDILAVVD